MIEIILTIVEQMALYLPLLLGSYLVFSLMRVPGLSIETAFVSGAIGAFTVLQHAATGWCFSDLVLAVLASLCGGACVGVLVASMVTIGRVPHLLASILTIGIGYGTNLFVLGAANKPFGMGSNPLLCSLFSTYLPTHPELIVLLLVAVLVLFVVQWFCRTQLGISIAVYGNNPRFFEQYGISTRFIVAFGLIIGNALAGLSGYLVAQTSGFVDIGAGNALTLFCITGLVLGRTLCFGSSAVVNVCMPVLGVLAYGCLQQSLLKLGFNLKYFMVMQALVVLSILVVRYRWYGAAELTTDTLGV